MPFDLSVPLECSLRAFAYTFVCFTVSHGGVEQVFRPAVKVILSGFSH